MKRTYDATNVRPSGGFDPAPAGTYYVVISKVTEKVSKNNDPLFEVIFEIDDINFLGKKIWHYVTLLPPESKGAGMAIHFLKSIGEPWEGVIDIDSEHWINKRCIAKVGIEKNLKGQDRNFIIELHAEMHNAPVSNGFVAEDSVPF